MTARHIIWTDTDGPGLEQLTLTRDSDDWLADGLQVGRRAEDPPFRFHYVIRIGDDRRMQSAVLRLTASGPDGPRELSLTVDEDAAWTDAAGNLLPELAGCHEINVPATPFTHMLPIRRLDLAAGETADISVVRINIPDLTPRAVRQRYTCLRPIGEQGGLFRYDPLSDGESCELPVDADGLVTDYPGGLQRAWAG